MNQSQNSLLPSGPWTGFYLEPHQPKRGWMHLYLQFEDGEIHGEGTDYVGPWKLTGTYDERQARWVKQYLGKHEVAYEGLVGSQGIQGQWDIRGTLTGSFHVWPAGLHEMNELYLREDLEQPSPGSQLLGTIKDDPFI